MKIGVRKASVACGTAFASLALAAITATSAWGASSALVIGGIATSSMHDAVMSQLLGGALKDQQRVSVNWPAEAAPYTGKNDLTLGASINIGVNNLNAQIDAALDRLAKDGQGNYINDEKVTVVGLSAGSLVVNEVLRQLAADAEAPDKNQITFVLVADSSRQKLINQTRYNKSFDYTYRPAPETEYDIVVVTGEYDGMADFPDRWWNGLAVLNAIAGGIYVHVPMMFADLSKVPAENITVDVNSKGGTTTNYLVPTAKLPLVQMFPSLAAREAELKAKIDKAYSRNDVRATALRTFVAAPAAVAEPVAAPAVIAEPVAEPQVEEKAVEAVTTAVADSDAQAESGAAAPVGDEVVEDTVGEAVVRDGDDADVAETDADVTGTVDGDAAVEDETDAAAQEDADTSQSADADQDRDSTEASSDSSSDESGSGSSDSSDSE
ncbi:PE-PPE domain-containing protein [Mycobacterium sp. 4D054]|uniref:PE-PPE domain-containing protein n=1 Tax=unclassified Mycobacterium TaxID=2642494 RepID=UPI0021B19ECA|nr:PE-PPE domain-containing protein [Mycobacterium sp. SMC-8]UXA09769.1 PE-PPE domain-containing protein [Mycobacterium sp. SMC-8]